MGLRKILENWNNLTLTNRKRKKEFPTLKLLKIKRNFTVLPSTSANKDKIPYPIRKENKNKKIIHRNTIFNNITQTYKKSQNLINDNH